MPDRYATKSVKELRKILQDREVDYSECLEKKDLVRKIRQTNGEYLKKLLRKKKAIGFVQKALKADDGKKRAFWLLEAAKLGDLEAMHNLYYSFKEGWEGQEKNVKTAFGWLKKAAEGGHDAAMHDMGVALYRGEDGQVKNVSKAAEWWAKAGEKGVAASLHNLGLMHMEGELSLLPDMPEAIRLLEKAGELGYPTSLTLLAKLERTKADGDMVKAKRYLKKAKKLSSSKLKAGSQVDMEARETARVMIKNLSSCQSTSCTQNLMSEKKEAVKVSLKACASCKQALYCSSSCQAQDWKARHKFACKGQSYLQKGNWEKAEQALDKAIALYPPTGSLFSFRCEARHQLKKFQGAQEDAQKALDLMSNTGSTMFYCARAELAVGWLSLAEKDCHDGGQLAKSEGDNELIVKYAALAKEIAQQKLHKESEEGMSSAEIYANVVRSFRQGRAAGLQGHGETGLQRGPRENVPGRRFAKMAAEGERAKKASPQ